MLIELVPCAVSLHVQGPQEPIAGGFLVGVDDVVQPYALPRNLREIVEHASTSHTALGELRTTNLDMSTALASYAAEELDADDVDVTEQGQEPLSLLDLDDKLDAVKGGESEEDDEAMEEVVVDAPPPVRTPKTMQELAEEAARRGENTNQPVDVEEELVIATQPQPAAEKATVNGRNTRASRSRAKSGTSTPHANTGGGKGKTSAASTSKTTSRQTRKRTRAQVERSDSDREEEGRGEVDRPTTAKKTRTRAPPPPPEPPTRVLRARKPKDADKMREEKKMEAAYRRAIAD